MREGRRLEIKEVAAATGIGESHLSRYERCERPLSYDRLKALAGYYDCDIDRLQETVLIDQDGQVLDADPTEAAVN